MDATQTHYINYDPDEVWRAMINAYIQEGGDVLYPGDEKEILLRAVLAIACGVMARVDAALCMDTLSYAVGEYLDLYGEKRGCARIAAVAATGTVQISFAASGVAQTIDAGMELTVDGTMLYHTTEDIRQSGAAQTVTAAIECSEAGAAGNGLLAGTAMQMINYNPAITSIVVSTGASGGRDEEEDEAYRERIRTYGLSSVTTGPSEQYEAQAKAVSTEVLDAKALNDGDGEVGVYVILEDGADAEALVAAIEAALSADTTRPLTDQVTVYEAEAVEYALHVTAHYASGSDIEAAIATAAEAYRVWQDETVGRAFNPDMLTASLFQAGCTRVEYADGDGIDGAGVTYTEIPARSRCLGAISVETVVDA